MCVSSTQFAGVHSIRTIFLLHGVEGRGRVCRFISCRFSVWLALTWVRLPIEHFKMSNFSGIVKLQFHQFFHPNFKFGSLDSLEQTVVCSQSALSLIALVGWGRLVRLMQKQCSKIKVLLHHHSLLIVRTEN